MDNNLTKPKFVSLAERKKAAIKRQALQVEEQKLQLAALNQQKVATESISIKPKAEASFQSDIPVVPAAIRWKEIEDIKKRYLNPRELILSTRHGKSINEKRLLFEWNANDDTSEQSFYDSKLNDSKRRLYMDKNGGENFAKNGQPPHIARHQEDSHWRDKQLEEMTDRDWRILKEDFDISTKGGSIPHPIRLWKESELSPRLQGTLSKYNYRQPTPIQRQSIPIILKGRDMIGVAETGSGKTLAFLLPFFEQLSHLRAISSNEPEDDDEKEERPSQGAVGLVLAPTRELVLQIESEYAKFAKSMGLAPPVAIVGGHSMTGQSFRLSEGVVDMIIATPGRLKDCLEQHVLSLRNCRYLVLDEADRMVDMGFEEDLTAILGCLPRNQYDGRVQKILFSATMPPGVERIARTYLSQVASFGTSNKLSTTDKTAPSHGLAVVTIGTAGQVVDRIEQRVELLSSDYQKRTRLFEVLGQLSTSTTGANGPIIIFVNHKETVDSVTRHLNSQDYKAIGLHGGRSQEQRESALQHLKSGKMNVLVATDVASRGIDVPNVSLVLNYDMAPSIESYIHRIGRTGRAGKLGLAHTFLVATQDAPLFYDLKNLLLKSSKSTCHRDLSEHEAANTKPGTIPQKKKSDETIFK